eukprot:3734645-Lingulodinium_polyedra.AAC.1
MLAMIAQTRENLQACRASSPARALPRLPSVHALIWDHVESAVPMQQAPHLRRAEGTGKGSASRISRVLHDRGAP